MRFFSYILSAYIISMVAVSYAAPQQNKGTDITGYYAEKNGEFFMVSLNGDVYQVLWRQKAGDWVGVAIRNEDRLAVAWQRSDRANLGVSFYKIEKGEKGPKLVGAWASLGDPKATPDTMSWSRKLDAATPGKKTVTLF